MISFAADSNKKNEFLKSLENPTPSIKAGPTLFKSIFNTNLKSILKQFGLVRPFAKQLVSSGIKLTEREILKNLTSDVRQFAIRGNIKIPTLTKDPSKNIKKFSIFVNNLSGAGLLQGEKLKNVENKIKILNENNNNRQILNKLRIQTSKQKRIIQDKLDTFQVSEAFAIFSNREIRSGMTKKRKMPSKKAFDESIRLFKLGIKQKAAAKEFGLVIFNQTIKLLNRGKIPGQNELTILPERKNVTNVAIIKKKLLKKTVDFYEKSIFEIEFLLNTNSIIDDRLVDNAIGMLDSLTELIDIVDDEMDSKTKLKDYKIPKDIDESFTELIDQYQEGIEFEDNEFDVGPIEEKEDFGDELDEFNKNIEDITDKLFDITEVE